MLTKTDSIPFENALVATNLSCEDAVRKLDCTIYFESLNIPLPSSLKGIAKYMLDEEVLKVQDNGLYAITNLGALAFAQDLTDFSSTCRKVLRIVKYKGKSRYTHPT